MGLPQEAIETANWALMPVETLPTALWLDYWQAMERSGRLVDRFCDTEQPTLDTVREMIWNMRPHTYMLVDLDLASALAECALTNFSGASAQVHFSVRPGLTLPTARDAGREMIRTILYSWQRGGRPFLRTLYGMLPSRNRKAIIFCLSCGFKRFGTVPYGMAYQNELCDGVVLIHTRRD